MTDQKDYSPLLTDISKQYINSEIEPVARVVVTAANRLGDSGIMLIGARHWDNAMSDQWQVIKQSIDVKPRDIKQGFIDQYGQFLTRREAYYVAHRNNQPLIGDDWGELYSENLH